MLRVLVAGATGWTGEAVARAVAAADDLELAGGIARSGSDHASVAEALAATDADVLVDYTSAAAVRANVDAALAGGRHVVVGSSGLTAETVLATPDERLDMRHKAGASSEPYVAGTLLAVRRVPEVTGVLRGLDRLLFD